MPVQLSYTFLCCVKYKHYFLKTMFIYLYLCQSYKSLKEVIKWIWLQVDPRAESRLFTPSFLECPFDIYLGWMHDRTQGPGSMETLRFGWVSVEVSSLNTPAKPCMSISLLTKTATYQPEVVCLFLRFLHALYVLEPVWGFIWETLKTVSQHEYLFTRWCLVFQATDNFALLIVYFWEQSS